MGMLFEVSYLAVLVAAVVGMIIGALWYSPLLFGKAWMKLMKLTEKDMKKAKEKGMTKNFAIAFAAVLVMAYVLAYVIDIANVGNIGDGVVVGFWLWLGFVATSMLNSVLWEGKPSNLYFINITHYFVVLLVMGAILVVMA